mmetsp:Transcript_36258/g.65091  ORF Transcript_36258/g.65091 Transcript_36258/m.65091 type:complete len:267 (+) Transcript_36258:2-802(+)
MVELGRTIMEIVSTIPGGVLVFMPSRSALDMALQAWSERTAGAQSLFDALAAQKGRVASESGPDAARALQRHEEAVAREGSAVLFCVYRGRSSEGISLSDHAVRGVVCVGIPLPPLSPAVRLKREYNDNVARASLRRSRTLDGETWYNLEAYRAVNQALGRVIRHRLDYGVAVLVDARWTAKGSRRAARYLPRWLRELVRLQDDAMGESLACPVDRLLGDLCQHFNHCSAWHQRALATEGGIQPTEPGSAETSSDATDRRVRPRRT